MTAGSDPRPRPPAQTARHGRAGGGRRGAGTARGRTVTGVDWSRLPLARATVDRAAHRRTEPDLLSRAWAAPTTRVLLLSGGRLLARGEDVPGNPRPSVALDLRSPEQLHDVLGHALPSAPGVLVVFLGEGPQGEAYLACAFDDARGASVGLEGFPDAGGPVDLAVEGSRWVVLRDVGHALDDHDAGLAAAAVGLTAWHERHPRCARCGAPTVPAQAGWVRTCTADGSDHYPRTDPAVIMAVVDDAERLLLGHAVAWPERRFSTLAGYVEPGESLESAVRREVAEEVGVVIGDVSYRGSQTWPFPASLMVAYVAQALSTEITVDGVEVTDARWFTRAALAEAVASGEVLLPMRTSVARALIEEWFGGTLGDA